MIKFVPPPGSETVYVTRRHWYEIVPETADTIWWAVVISALAVSLSSLCANPRLLAILLLVAYPMGAYLKELVLWNHELYVVLRLANGKGRLVKVAGVLKRKQVDDAITEVGRVQETTLLGRYLGFAKVDIQTPSRTYISGRLVPLKLLSAMDSVEKAALTLRGDENTRQVMMAQLASWLEHGLVDRETAQIATRRFLLEEMR